MFCKNTFLKISQNAQRNTCARVSFRRSSCPEVFYKNKVLENFSKFTGKHLARVSFLIKLQAWDLQHYQKRDSGTGASCEFCEISKNNFSYRTPPVAVSASNTVKCVQAVKLATLLKRNTRTSVSEPAVCRSSTK